MTITSAGPSGLGRPAVLPTRRRRRPSTVTPSASVSSAWASWSAASLTVRISSTRPGIRSTARGIATRDAMPSAYVAALGVSIGRPAAKLSVIAGAASAWMPTIRVSGDAWRNHDPTPLISAPLPTGTAATASAGSRPASVASVSSRASVAAPVEIRGSSPSTRSSAPCSRAYASDPPLASSKSSPISITSAPSARIRATFARFARVEANTTAGTPSARAA